MATAKITTKTAQRKKTTPKKYFECICCHVKKEESDFYKSKGSLVWQESEGRSLFCKECLAPKFRIVRERYGERYATMIMCHWVDAPYVESVYQAVVNKETDYDFGHYMRTLNGPQYSKRSFVTSIVDGDFAGPAKTIVTQEEIDEGKWTRDELRIKNEVVELLGSDPFAGYPDSNRRHLYGELSQYLDEDVIEDPYKLSQIRQIVVNNDQIRAYDVLIAKLDPRNEAEEIKTLNTIKKDLVSSNDKIAKENEISVKNRSNKEVGKSTLTYLMRDLREKDFKQAEANYYDQLRGEGTLWAMEMSNRALLQNTMFDENDKQDIFIEQRQMIQKQQAELDDLREENRLLKVEVGELKSAQK